jgi:hypothetical protein
MDIQRIVAELRGEMDRIGHAIGLLEGNTTAKARVDRPPASAGRSPVRRGGGITPAGRRRLAEAMRLRWAQRKGAATRTSAASTSVSASSKPKKRGGITAAGRKKLAEAMRKRWAEKKRMAKS